MNFNTLDFHFRIDRVRPVEELEATLYEMTHEPTGARLIWLDRDSENMTFSITFPTIAENDTGVFHILEHSVLCGSRRYPVKEPFVELMKSSMQTFLNAFTYPDKTVYPICSRNKKDFINLMRIYLDAVFFPAIYEKPEIFRQEGWHYHFDAQGVPTYNGVVYSEMKGVFASPDSLLQYEMNRLMFPDTCYRFVSGGDPAHIPELTYEQFLAQHKKFYHPSNSYIVLDGSISLDQILEILDSEYLSSFSCQPVDTKIPYQKPVTAPKSVCYYAVADDEPLTNKARLGFGYGLGDFSSRKEVAAMNALSDLLCGSNFSPLKERILSQHLAQDVSLGVMDGILQNYVVISADDADETRLAEFQAAVTEVVTQQLTQGLDHEHLKAILANMELRARERDYGYTPQGLGLCCDILDSWLYGGDPAQNLSIGPLFAQLNALVDQGWYEALLERVLLRNDHTCQVVLLPSHEVFNQSQQAQKQALAAVSATWDENTRQRLQAQQESLTAFQEAPDSPQALATLPRLCLSDIPAKPRDIPTEISRIGTTPVLHHSLSTGGLSYWNLYFDVSDLTQEEIPTVSVLCQALGQLATKQVDALQLQKLLDLYTGHLDICLHCYSQENVPENCKCYLCVSFNCLESKAMDAIGVIVDLLRSTDFSDTEQLRDILCQCRMHMEQVILGAGNSIGLKRVMAGLSTEGVILEQAAGYSFFQRLKALQEDPRELTTSLPALCQKLFCQSRMTLSITGPKDQTAAAHLLSSLPQGAECHGFSPIKPWGPVREGIAIASDVSFAVLGGLCAYSPQMSVATHILSLDHLWNAVRVQGGAYGVDVGVSDRGCGSFYSYRDPDPKRSLEAYRASADFLAELLTQQEDLTGFIIGTLSSGDPVLLPGAQGRIADTRYFKGITYQQRCDYRKAILETTHESLKALLSALQELCQGQALCVVGPRQQLQACGLDVIHTM